MFPGVENIKNPHHFRSRVFLEELPQGTSQNIWALPEELAQGKSQNIGAQILKNTSFSSSPEWKSLTIHFIFDPAFPEELAQGKSQNIGLDFEKHFIFMFARVETFENPLHFQIRAFLEDLAQGKSQNVGARISKNTSFSYSPWWKTLKIHIIFDSGFCLRSYPKAYLKMLGRTQFSQKA
ncbi:hypothetical protein E2320_022440 [Naja naja]|nr:hypothetical protein E2320_022440 [Naja naja]